MTEQRSTRESLVGGDLRAFLEDKEIALECRECGKDDMLIQADGPDEPLYLFKLAAEHSYSVPGTFTSLFAMFCMNCGNMRTYAAEVVLQWKESKEPRGE